MIGLGLASASAALSLRSRQGFDKKETETAVDVENQQLAKVPANAEKKKGITSSKTTHDNLPLLDIHNLRKQFLAALVMYSQGLIYLWNSECNAQIMLQAIVNSWFWP